MKKIKFAILLTILLLPTGCSARNPKALSLSDSSGSLAEANISKVENCPFRLKQIAMFDMETGWGITTENEILFTENGPEAFVVIREMPETDKSTYDFVSAAFPEKNTAYLAYFPPDRELLTVEYTVDGGASWRQTSVEYGGFGETCDAGSAYLDFTDPQNGFLLYCSAPGAGQMTKLLLRTGDGAESFSLQKDLSAEIAGYPQGISFSDHSGYIAVSYHGEDSYLYASSDGGFTWEDRKIISPGNSFSGQNTIRYIDGYAAVFCPTNRRKGMIILKTVGDHSVYRLFVTEDGGDNWKPTAEALPWDSLSGCSLAEEDCFYFLDGDGNLYSVTD